MTTIFLVGLSIYTYNQIKNLSDSAEIVNRTTHVSLELEKLIGSVKDSETGHRGYLLTHDSAFLEPFYKGLKEYPEHVENLKQLILDNKIQQNNLIELKRLCNNRERYMYKMLEIDKTKTTPTAKEMLVGKSIMDSLRTHINSMNTIETKLFQLQRQKYIQISILTPLFIVVLFLGALLILFVSYYRLNKAMHESNKLHKTLKELVMEAPAGVCMLRGPDHYIELANNYYISLTNNKDICYKYFREALPELKESGVLEILDTVYKTGETIEKNEVLIKLNQKNGTQEDRLFNFSYKATHDDEKKIDGIFINALDVTEQNKAHKKIEESQLRYKELINKLPVAVYTCNAEGYIESFNEAAVNLWGRTPDLGKDMWCGSWKIYKTDGSYLPLEDCPMAIALKKGEIIKMEIIIERPDGSKRSIIPNPQPIYDCEGTISGAINTLVDITEQVDARNQIEKNEEQLRIAIEGGELGTFDFNPQTGEFMLSDKTKELFGLSTHDNVNYDTYLKALHPADKENFKTLFDILTKSQSDEMYDIEYRVIGISDGKLKWLRLKGKSTFDTIKKSIRFTGVIHDVTTHKLAEQTLKQSESRFRTLADSMPQHIWTADVAGNLNYFNESVFSFSGLTSEQINKDGWLQIVHPDEREENIKLWTEAITTGNDFLFEHRFRRYDGEYRWQLSRAIPQKNDSGEIQMWVGISTDIQSQKMFTNELEILVKNRTIELTTKNKELEKMNKELELFTHISSHDLQEPLRKVQMSISRIEENDFDTLSDKGKEHFKRVLNATITMQTLIEDLQTYSRTNNKEGEFEITDLNLILEETIEELKERIEEKNAIIEKSLLISEANIIPFEFRQLMHNLIGNALKFSKPDNVPHIIIKGKAAKGSELNNINLLPDEKYCYISISDNGIGFEPQYNEKIFEVFQRLHGKEKYKGTGIGLAIVKKILENHNGIITAKGELNNGAIFEIYIPTT